MWASTSTFSADVRCMDSQGPLKPGLWTALAMLSLAESRSRNRWKALDLTLLKIAGFGSVTVTDWSLRLLSLSNGSANALSLLFSSLIMTQPTSNSYSPIKDNVSAKEMLGSWISNSSSFHVLSGWSSWAQYKDGANMALLVPGGWVGARKVG